MRSSSLSRRTARSKSCFVSNSCFLAKDAQLRFGQPASLSRAALLNLNRVNFGTASALLYKSSSNLNDAHRFFRRIHFGWSHCEPILWETVEADNTALVAPSVFRSAFRSSEPCGRLAAISSSSFTFTAIFFNQRVAMDIWQIEHEISLIQYFLAWGHPRHDKVVLIRFRFVVLFRLELITQTV